MKTFLTVIICLFFTFLSAKSQLKEYREINRSLIEQHFDEEIMNQFKGTTTVFFCPTGKKAQADSIKKAITSAWTITPIIVDDISKFYKYAGNPKYSYFVIEGSYYSKDNMQSTHYFLSLRLYKDVDRKGRISTTDLCRIELYPNNNTLFMSWRGKDDEITERVYEKGLFFNWTPILLKAQLSAVSTDLSKNMKASVFNEPKIENLNSLLSKDTLYVPQGLLMNFSGLSGKEKSKEENVFESYKYPYKICINEELFQIFETEHRGRFLFEYVKSSTDKFVTIYDLKDKTIVYKEYTAISYNLKSKDIEKITR